MMLFNDVHLSSHLKMCIVESLLVFMHSWQSYLTMLYLTMVWTKSVTYLRCPKYLTMVIGLVPHAYRVELGTLHSLSSIFEDVV